MIVWDKEKVKSAVALQCLECQHCSYFWQITGLQRYFCKDFKNPLLLGTFAPCHRPAVIISPVFMLIWFVTNYTTGKDSPCFKLKFNKYYIHFFSFFKTSTVLKHLIFLHFKADFWFFCLLTMNQSPTLMHHKNIVFLSLVQMSNNNIAFMAECTAARH